MRKKMGYVQSSFDLRPRERIKAGIIKGIVVSGPGVSTILPPRSWNRMCSPGLKPRLCTITGGTTAKNEELSLMLSLHSCIFSMPSANTGDSFKTVVPMAPKNGAKGAFGTYPTGAKGAKKRRQRPQSLRASNGLSTRINTQNTKNETMTSGSPDPDSPMGRRSRPRP